MFRPPPTRIQLRSGSTGPPTQMLSPVPSRDRRIEIHHHRAAGDQRTVDHESERAFTVLAQQHDSACEVQGVEQLRHRQQ